MNGLFPWKGASLPKEMNHLPTTGYVSFRGVEHFHCCWFHCSFFGIQKVEANHVNAQSPQLSIGISGKGWGVTLPTSTLAACEILTLFTQTVKSCEAKKNTQEHLEPKKNVNNSFLLIQKSVLICHLYVSKYQSNFHCKTSLFPPKNLWAETKMLAISFCKKKVATNSRKQRKRIHLREKTIGSASGVGFFKPVHCVPSGPSASHSGLSPLGTSEVFSSWVAGGKWEKPHTKKVFFHDLLIFFGKILPKKWTKHISSCQKKEPGLKKKSTSRALTNQMIWNHLTGTVKPWQSQNIQTSTGFLCRLPTSSCTE